MRLTVTLLFAALLAPAGAALAQAQSFDPKALSTKAPAPIKRPADRAGGMKPCPEYGAGFYRLDGSATCVRISGGVGTDVGTSGVRR